MAAKNDAVWQSFLKLLDLGVSDLRSCEVQVFKPTQPLQMFQPSIRHLRTVDTKVFKLSQPSETCQPGVSHLRIRQN